MITFTGKGVCGGVAVGRVSLFRRNTVRTEKTEVDDTEGEKKRFEGAKAAAAEQLERVYQKALAETGEENAQIFEIHKMMLEDEDFNGAVTDLIDCHRVNAEYAVLAAAERFSAMFSAMDDSYMQARAADVRDISNRLLECLSQKGEEGEEQKDEKIILCADDLSPSETVSLDQSRVLAFVTAKGSGNSHTAILARSMNIPAVIGVGEEFLSRIQEGDLCIADGDKGQVVIHPDRETLTSAEDRQKTDLVQKQLLQSLKGKENITLDGTRVEIYANIGSADEADAALSNDAGGIGLFRSEFLYLEGQDYPTEEQQFQAYRKVARKMAGKKVVIRTLDIGADKQADYFGLEREENPAMGFRAIRICLARPEIFKTQLRALYRASAFGEIAIMFPMITSVSEVEEILALCREVRQELDAGGIAYASKVELGIMIETPAAALISDRLAPLVDFFSVGTNDLIQYTLACDRQNPALERFCDLHHEAVFRLIGLAAENAHKEGAWIGICGELAADTTLTETFLRMGIDELSVSPPSVLKVREAVRNLHLGQREEGL
ncbi:MAG: phosphoenolpyruvate--protein phosphotransferase [Clostridia bacterium]|nr:phosphoenolpyruvate--protein phosphotransferase [Clostridia bacterium]